MNTSKAGTTDHDKHTAVGEGSAANATLRVSEGHRTAKAPTSPQARTGKVARTSTHGHTAAFEGDTGAHATYDMETEGGTRVIARTQVKATAGSGWGAKIMWGRAVGALGDASSHSLTSSLIGSVRGSVAWSVTRARAWTRVP